jgi:hypothetical protein
MPFPDLPYLGIDGMRIKKAAWTFKKGTMLPVLLHYTHHTFSKPIRPV